MRQVSNRGLSMSGNTGKGRPTTNAPKPQRMKLVSPSILGLVAVTLLVGAMLGSLLLTQSPTSTPAQAGGQSQAVEIGGPFHLLNQNGQAVDESILRGRWSLVFFGYVSCPDICPATMQTIAAAESRMGADAAHLQVVFVTVDPARDTAPQLKAWIEQPGFPRSVAALTGTDAQVAAAAKAYRIFFKKEEGQKDYQVAHSAAIYLMDPQGRFAAPLYYEQGPARLAHDISAAMHKG